MLAAHFSFKIILKNLVLLKLYYKSTFKFVFFFLVSAFLGAAFESRETQVVTAFVQDTVLLETCDTVYLQGYVKREIWGRFLKKLRGSGVIGSNS